MFRVGKSNKPEPAEQPQRPEPPHPPQTQPQTTMPPPQRPAPAEAQAARPAPVGVPESSIQAFPRTSISRSFPKASIGVEVVAAAGMCL